MSLKKLLLTTAIASTTLSWFANNENSNYNLNNEEDSIDMVQQEPILQIPTLTKEKLYICLNTDENSYTHTEVLKNIPEDGHEIVLEYPVEQLFKTYNKRPHPLAVWWVAKTYWALMGKNNLSERLNRYPQHLSQSVNAITSQTKYATTDTLRFWLIESDLAESFPFKLSDQLKEDWFEKYSDKDSLLISKKNKPHYVLPDDLYKLLSKYNTDKDDTNKEYIYDIVVKKLTDVPAAYRKLISEEKTFYGSLWVFLYYLYIGLIL